MAAIGYAMLPIAPSMRSIQAKIRREFEKPLADASKRAGDAMTKGLVDAAEKASRGVEKARQREIQAALKVENAEKRVQAAKAATEKAARTVEAAEKQLEAVRAKSDAAVAKAEANVQKVRADSKASAADVEAAEKQLQAVRAKADADVAQAENRVADARDKSRNATNKLKDSEDRVVAAQKRAKDATHDVKNALKEYESEAGRSSKATETLGDKFRDLKEKSLAGMGGKLKGLGMLAAGAVGVNGAANFMGDAISKGRELSTVFGTMQAVTNATEAEMAALDARAKELGKDNTLAGTSTASAAAAMLALQKGGMGVQQSMDAAKGSIQLAGAAMMDGGEAAELQIAALNSFGLQASEAGRVADVLTNAFNNSATDARDLGEALKYTAPTAASLGISLEDTNTMIGIFANNGVKGSQAGTAMRSALLSMTSPSKKAANAMDDLGLSADENGVRFHSMRDTIEKLQKAQQDLGNDTFLALATDAFGKEAVSFAVDAAAAGVEGFDQLREKMDETGSAAETAAGKQKGLNKALDEAENASDDLKQTLYEMLEPKLAGAAMFAANAFEKMSDGLKKTAEWLKEHPVVADAAKSAFVGLTGAVIAFNVANGIATAGGLLPYLQKLVRWTKMQTLAQAALNTVTSANPYVLLATAIAAVVSGLVYFFTQTETGKKVWGQFTDFLGDAWKKFSDGVKDGWEKIKGYWDDFTDYVAKMKHVVSNAWDEIKSIFGGDNDQDGKSTPFLDRFFGADVVDKFQAAIGMARSVGSAIKSASDSVGSFLQGMAQGAANMAQGFVQVMSGMWDTVQAVWKSGVDGITTIFDGFGGIFGAIGQSIVDGWGTVGEIVKTIWDGLWGSMQDSAAGWILIISNLIQGDWAGAWEAFQTAASSSFQRLTGAFQQAGNLLTQYWNDTKNRLMQAFAEFGAKLAAWWEDTKNSIAASIVGAGVSLLSWWENTKQQFIQSMVNLLLNMQQHWEQFKQDTRQKLVEIGAALISFVADARANFEQAMGSILASIAGFFLDMKNKASSHLAALGRDLQGFPGKVKSWFANLPGELYNAGVQAITRFGDGIKSTWAGLQSWAARQLHLPMPGGRAVGGRATGGLMAYAAGGRHTGYQLPTTGPGTQETDGFLAFSQNGIPIARLDAGEWVINQRSSAKYHRELAAINAGVFPKLPGYEDGGFIARTSDEIKSALSKVASPYVWGGWSMAGTDCSGAVSMAVNVFRGLDILDSRTDTSNMAKWLGNKGFSRGAGGKGDFTVAFLNGGPGGGHTAAQLPDDTFIESGGNTGQGLTIGGKAGPLQGRGFTDWFHAQGKDLADKVAGAVGDSLTQSGVNPASTIGTSVSVNWGSAQELHSKIAKAIGVKSQVSSSPVGVSSPGAGDPMLPDSIRDQALKSWDGPDWGPEFFVHEVARSAKEAGLGVAAAIIGVATTLVESGNPLKMWANKAVPESLSFRHDAVGSDYDSIGLFQQRQAGWGTVEDRMTPFKSAGMFFDRLKRFDWESMDPGAAAQKVQVSAFPDRYATQMDKAKELVASAGVYDTGGVLPHKGAAFNLSGKNEVINTNDELKANLVLANNTGALAKQVGELVQDFRTALPKLGVLERAAYAGNFRGGAALGIEEDHPLVDVALQFHEQMMSIGGDWVGKAELVQDAERGLAQTRAAIAADLDAIDKKEAELAKLRAEYAEATANGGEATQAATRKIADAEKRLARAREDLAGAKTEKQRTAVLRRIEDAEEKLTRAREDAAKSAEKSGDKSAKDAVKISEKIAKAEKELAKVRDRSEQATLQLEAAERTVIAARVQTIGDLVGKVVSGFQKMADGMREFWEKASQVTAAVEATQAEISKLRLQAVNDYAAMLRANRELRRAEFDALRTRLQGPVDAARAESKLAAAKKKLRDAEMKGIELVSRKGGTSLIDLGDAIDRFTETGIFGLENLIETADGGMVQIGAQMSATVQQSTEQFQQYMEERRAAEDEVKAAEWEVHTARLANLVQQQQAAALAEENQIKSQIAAVKHGQTLELLQLATMKLGEQAQAFYGMTSQGASRAAAGWGGFGKILGGIGKVVAGGAMALATGGIGAIPGLMMAASGIGDVFKGGSDVKNNWQDVKDSWKKSDGWGKAGMVFGVAGNALSTAGGAYLTTQGYHEAGTQMFELGATIQDSTIGSMFYDAESKNKAAESRYQERLQATQWKQQVDMAALEQKLVAVQEKNAIKLESLESLKAFTEIQQEIAKASSKPEALALHEIGKVYLQNAEKAMRQGEQSAADMRQSRETLEQMKRDADQRAKSTGAPVVTVNIPRGQSYSSEEVQRQLEVILGAVDNLEYKINQIDAGASGVSGSEYLAARQYS